MKAVVYHGLGDIRLDNVRDPKLKDPQLSMRVCRSQQSAWSKYPTT